MDQSFLQECVWKDLIKAHPYSHFDGGSYWTLAENCLLDKLDPAWRFVSNETKKKCNFKSNEDK